MNVGTPKGEFIEGLNKAESNLRIADHLVYITYPLLKESRLLLKVLENLYKTASTLVDAILKHEYSLKRIELYYDKNIDWQTFRNKCAPRFGITSNESQTIRELLSLMERRNESSTEFMRGNRLIIMSDNFRAESVSLGKLKSYLNLLREVVKKLKDKVERW